MNLDLQKSILKDIRIAVGLSEDVLDFDTELLMHINVAIATLNQNGIGNFIVVENDEPKWIDLQDPTQIEGNKYFKMVPLFVTISTKILFDPPPPSSVQYHEKSVNQILWRLKVAYEVYNDNILGGESDEY